VRSRGSLEDARDDAALDRVVWSALTGPQAGLAEVHGRAARFHPDVSPFSAIADERDPGAWQDLAALIGPGADALFGGAPVTPPPGWQTVLTLPGIQLVGAGVAGQPDPEALVLGAADLPEVLDLVERTRPGPFRPRTIELGTYLGIRREGALIAMAGERLRIPAHTEISAVCTDPAFRGQGLAARLIRAVAAGTQARGDRPFLHTTAGNASAIRLYEHLGFAVRRPVAFAVYRSPQT